MALKIIDAEKDPEYMAGLSEPDYQRMLWALCIECTFNLNRGRYPEYDKYRDHLKEVNG